MRENFCLPMVRRKQLICFLILALIHMVFVAYIYLRSPYFRKQGFVRLLQHRLFQHKPPNCNINFTQSAWSKVNVTWETLENKMSFNLHPGGRYNPEGCHLLDDIVVLIPYRNREDQLKTFIYYMHPFLQSKKISYRIVVVEMAPGANFNRAMLFNIGFMEMNKASDHQCYIFHDVDLLPENTSTPYNCDKSPRHMAVAIDKNNYKLPYESYFGGICSLTKEHFQRINGFSNQYFGWGGEDDDFHDRLKRAKLNISRLSLEEGRFHMLLHPTEEPNPEKLELFKSMKARSSFDGLNSLKYEVLKYELKPLYTWILVNINETNVKTFDREQLIKINEALAKNNRTIHRKPHIRHTKLVRNSSVV